MVSVGLCFIEVLDAEMLRHVPRQPTLVIASGSESTREYRRASLTKSRARRHSCEIRHLSRVALTATRSFQLAMADSTRRFFPPNETPPRRLADKARWSPNHRAGRPRFQSRHAKHPDE